MGSGSRFRIQWVRDCFGGVGLGIYVSRFPHELSIDISLVLVHIYIGFGKGYDE